MKSVHTTATLQTKVPVLLSVDAFAMVSAADLGVKALSGTYTVASHIVRGGLCFVKSYVCHAVWVFLLIFKQITVERNALTQDFLHSPAASTALKSRLVQCNLHKLMPLLLLVLSCRL